MLGLGTSLVKGGMAGRQYVRDGLKLYMPYKGANIWKGVQFVGTGSTSFDGVDDYVSVADDSTLDFGTGDFSVAGWFKWERGSASDDSVGSATSNHMNNQIQGMKQTNENAQQANN